MTAHGIDGPALDQRLRALEERLATLETRVDMGPRAVRVRPSGACPERACNLAANHLGKCNP